MGVNLFGVRHLSPAAAHHLRRTLEEIRPELVLVEGPSDLNDQMPWLCHPGTEFPVAILAYTRQAPVRTLLYPFARYSPEMEAVLWCHQHKVKCRFMDLPSAIFLGLEEERARQWAEELRRLEEQEERGEADEETSADGEPPEEELPEEPEEDSGDTTESVYRRLELAAGEDHDAFWERTFEQVEDTAEYREACNAFGRQLRELSRDDARRTAETLVREAYMKREIQSAIDGGIPPEKIVCVCGAFHVAGLEENGPMSDEELAKLPRADSTATLMPYSYYRLTSRSGYGAGNKAPAYFELLWNCWEEKGGPEEVPYRYLVRLAAAHRRAGNIVSSAEVIEAKRLADALRDMRGGRYPCLADLRDAAVTAMGHGSFGELSVAAADTEIGKRIGSLPEGVSRTSVQEDFYRQLKELRLEKYRAAETQRLDLDLRERLNVKSRDAALIDLRRSFFLHRLRVLGIHFAALPALPAGGGQLGEYWDLRWSPDTEIEVVESSLLGDTIEGAAAFALKERADNSASVAEAAAIFQDAFLCGMPAAAAHALTALQGLSVDAAALTEVAAAAEQLSLVVRYGDLRRFDSAPVLPLLRQLYLRACLTMEEACQCDAKAAPGVTAAMERLNLLQLNHDFLEEERWIKLMETVSDRDDLNTRCSGFAMAILLERGKADEELLGREVSRRLSPGVPADLGAGWFEGLAAKNRYALIARLSLWRHLSGYIGALDDTDFRRALVFLRRAFADFTPMEKQEIAENLGEIWGVDTRQAAELLMRDLTEQEKETLSELDEFDFDDI